MPEAKLDIADELLVAYVDGELDPQRRAMVDAALERDPTVALRLEAFVLSRDLLLAAFPVEMHSAQLPEGIRAAAAHLAAADAPPSGRIVTATFGSARPPLQDGASATAKPARKLRWIAGIAASLAVSTAGTLSYVVWHAREHSEVILRADVGRIEHGNPLYEVLERTPSARVVTVGGQNHQARSMLTFRTRDGRYCREFEVIAGAAVSTGLACRSQGYWRTEILLTGTAGAADAGQSYQAAGGHNEAAMATVVGRLMLGDPLSAAEESHLLSTGWH